MEFPKHKVNRNFHKMITNEEKLNFKYNTIPKKVDKWREKYVKMFSSKFQKNTHFEMNILFKNEIKKKIMTHESNYIRIRLVYLFSFSSIRKNAQISHPFLHEYKNLNIDSFDLLCANFKLNLFFSHKTKLHKEKGTLNVIIMRIWE